MSGGNKSVVFNTRERVVSTDQNRHQAFAASDRAEVLRRLMGMHGFGTPGIIESGSYIDTTAADAAAVGTPITADVYDGLVVLPQAASLNLLVSPGCVGLDDPDGQTGSSDPTAPNPDDSRLKVVVDPGIQTAGALVIGAGSGSTRVDVIEVQRVTTVLETDSRDIFDPSTGNFVPVSVPKVIAGRLTYRVRAGTPGGGLPANVQGWLPLCVAVVPSSATTVDGMDFWDVRPLVSARVEPPGAGFHISSRLQGRAFANQTTVPAETNLIGFITNRVGDYTAGGFINRGGAAIDIASLDFTTPGYTPVTGDFWNLVAVFPGSLPRWVRYLDSPAPRIPNGPNGVLTITGIGPDDFGSYGSVTPAAATGLPAARAVHLVAGYCFGGTKPGGIIFEDGLVINDPNNALALAPASASLSLDRFDIIQNDNVPGNAKSLLVYFLTTLSGTNDARYTLGNKSVSLFTQGGAVAWEFLQLGSEVGTLSGAGTAIISTPTMEIPLTFLGTLAGVANNNYAIVISYSGSGIVSRSSSFMVIVGWRL
jgi:hypothetical protein